MRADHVGGGLGPCSVRRPERNFDIADRPAGDVEFLQERRKTHLGQLALDVAGGGLECWIVIEIVWNAGDRGDVPA